MATYDVQLTVWLKTQDINKAVAAIDEAARPVNGRVVKVEATRMPEGGEVRQR